MSGTSDQGWLRSEGEMARHIRAHSWEATPLRAIEHWPAAAALPRDTGQGAS